MTSPLLSVLMPVYNAERYVAQAVESILDQTFQDFEFLIMDDGSTDRSLSILKRYAARDARIHLVSRSNAGYVSALNEMLLQAQGRYIARMDADDVALPDRFKHQVSFLQQHPDVVCVGGAFELIDHKGRFLVALKIGTTDAEIQQAALAGHGSICHPTAMMRRSALLKIGGYDETLMPAEDVDLWLKLGEVGQLANLEKPVLRYRLHCHSVSAQAALFQREQARRACEFAWKRRNIKCEFEAANPWRPGRDAKSRYQFMLQYGWWALSSGERSTAAIYGLKAIRVIPYRLEGWKLLACALFKAAPQQLPLNLKPNKFNHR
jgi:glycosyltransferase involved in cell wall biosynthesis